MAHSFAVSVAVVGACGTLLPASLWSLGIAWPLRADAQPAGI
jgi:hypothetical protein